jgi:hypothetical protein
MRSGLNELGKPLENSVENQKKHQIELYAFGKANTQLVGFSWFGRQKLAVDD